MKFLVCGDLHITDKMPYSSKQNDRSEELIDAWGLMCRTAREEKIDYIVIVGDVFDDINISPKSFAIFKELMKMSSGIRKIVVGGNHEIDEEGNALIKELSDYDRDLGISAPEPGSKASIFPFSYNTDLLLFDYHNSYQELKARIRMTIRNSKAKHKIFVGHQPIEGMEMRDAMFCTHGIPKTWFKKNGIIGKNFDLVLMGDFHRRQEIKGDIEGYYVGSLIQHSFRDEGSSPSYLKVDLKEELVSVYPVACPQFHTVRYIEGKPKPDQLLTKGGYVKLTVIGTQEYVDSLDINEIRDEIIEKHKPIQIITSNPTITCSVPKASSMTVSRSMSDEELVEKIISTDKSKLPDKLRYDVGVKYLRRAKE